MAFQLPRISGKALIAARSIAEFSPSGDALYHAMRSTLKIDELAKLPSAVRGAIPLHAKPIAARPPRQLEPQTQVQSQSLHWPYTVDDYARIYREHRASPVEVANAILQKTKELASRLPTMNVVAAYDEEQTQQAAFESQQRVESNRTRSAMEGVPLFVKDEFDVRQMATMGGATSPVLRAEQDASLVARLREHGMMFMAKTVMTEYGMSPIGANVHYSMPHNPFDATRAAGGSSTGSAVAVSMGLCPIATAADGGGSIRIPSALCGVFGLKPTFGRVTRAGDIFSGTVVHCGPIAASTSDIAHFMDAVALHPDPQDPMTYWPEYTPESGYRSAVNASVKGLRIGVDEAEWAHADPQIAEKCREALHNLEQLGAHVVPIHMNLPRYAARIGYLTIGPEALAGNLDVWENARHLLGDDLRTTFAILSRFPAHEMVDAQRLREGLRQEMVQLFCDVDLIALPSTAILAPFYSETDSRTSFMDPIVIDGVCRYVFLTNLTGHPAGSVPVGQSREGLPIGLQLIGDAWDEMSVIAAMAALERQGIAQVIKPNGALDLFA